MTDLASHTLRTRPVTHVFVVPVVRELSPRRAALGLEVW